MSETRMGKDVLLGALALLLTPVLPAAAFELKDLLKPLAGPKIEIPIEHPPEIALKVDTVAIAQPEGQCSQPLATRIEQDFVQSGVTVIDRRRLKEVLTEHKLQVSGAIDEKTAARVGQLLGAQALLFLQVQQCTSGRNRRELYTDQQSNRKVYENITQATIGGSLRIVDLTSGRVLAAQRFEGSAALADQNAYPDREVTLAEAEKSAAAAVQKKLLPWTEVKSLAFYNDAQCDLKLAHRSVKAQNFADAMRQSQANLASCQQHRGVKPATLARAHYNLGMMQFLFKDYDAALASFAAASRLTNSKTFLDAIDECRRAQGYSLALASYRNGTLAKNLPLVPSPEFTATPRPQSTAAAQQPPSIEARLSRLDDLLKKQLITPDEYQQQRTKILNEI